MTVGRGWLLAAPSAPTPPPSAAGPLDGVTRRVLFRFSCGMIGAALADGRDPSSDVLEALTLLDIRYDSVSMNGEGCPCGDCDAECDRYAGDMTGGVVADRTSRLALASRDCLSDRDAREPPTWGERGGEKSKGLLRSSEAFSEACSGRNDGFRSSEGGKPSSVLNEDAIADAIRKLPRTPKSRSICGAVMGGGRHAGTSPWDENSIACSSPRAANAA